MSEKEEKNHTNISNTQPYNLKPPCQTFTPPILSQSLAIAIFQLTNATNLHEPPKANQNTFSMGGLACSIPSLRQNVTRLKQNQTSLHSQQQSEWRFQTGHRPLPAPRRPPSCYHPPFCNHNYPPICLHPPCWNPQQKVCLVDGGPGDLEPGLLLESPMSHHVTQLSN